ncbi:MAG: T9SS type A sorting domain-containing protein [Bacteroidetes bacterium]|nr:T9SS type A sorting domain-containing protein [Bacteroidota bacterium]
MKIIKLLFLLFVLLNFSYSSQDSLYVTLSADTVKIWNVGVYVNCACSFMMDVNVSSDTIFITEIDTSKDWATCMCYFDLCINITGLEPGNYTAVVYRTLAFDPNIYYVGSISFTVNNKINPYSFTAYQSPCNQISSTLEYHKVSTKFELFTNHPNPFNPTTTIEFSIPVFDFVTLKIYNLSGQEIETLINENIRAGKYKIVWNARENPSGIYFCRLNTSTYSAVRKLILIK